eukprot:6948658-Pyramimonas_sp.AAC.1
MGIFSLPLCDWYNARVTSTVERSSRISRATSPVRQVSTWMTTLTMITRCNPLTRSCRLKFVLHCCILALRRRERDQARRELRVQRTGVPWTNPSPADETQQNHIAQEVLVALAVPVAVALNGDGNNFPGNAAEKVGGEEGLQVPFHDGPGGGVLVA